MDSAIIAIVQQIRDLGPTGNYKLPIAVAIKLVEDFGKQEYTRGKDSNRKDVQSDNSLRKFF